MARYRIYASATVGEGKAARLVPASLDNPGELEIPNATKPSRTWDPLDESAQNALEQHFKVKKKIPHARIAAKEPTVPEPMTLREAGEGGPKKSRAAEQ